MVLDFSQSPLPKKEIGVDKCKNYVNMRWANTKGICQFPFIGCRHSSVVEHESHVC